MRIPFKTGVHPFFGLCYGIENGHRARRIHILGKRIAHTLVHVVEVVIVPRNAVIFKGSVFNFTDVGCRFSQVFLGIVVKKVEEIVIVKKFLGGTLYARII